MTAIITRQQIIEAHACRGQVDDFTRLFGESVVVTVAKARKVASVFDWDFAVRFLDDEGWAEYKRVSGAALAEYRSVSGPAWAEYQRVSGVALAEYTRVSGPAWAAAYIATCKRRKAGL